METLFFLLCSAFFASIWTKLEKMDGKIDSLEIDVAIMKRATGKRRDDHVDFTLE